MCGKSSNQRVIICFNVYSTSSQTFACWVCVFVFLCFYERSVRPVLRQMDLNLYDRTIKCASLKGHLYHHNIVITNEPDSRFCTDFVVLIQHIKACHKFKLLILYTSKYVSTFFFR